MIHYVFFIFITAFGSDNTITFEAQSQAACEQMHKAVTDGIKTFFGKTRATGAVNFTGTITECEEKK